MDGVADEPSPASSTKQSTSQPSLLCQACQSVLTRDKLNFDEFHPHHSSLETFIEASGVRCYICSWLFSGLSVDTQDSLRLLVEGRLQDNMNMEEAQITDGGISNSKTEFLDHIGGRMTKWDKSVSWVSFTGMQIVSTRGPYLQVWVQLNPLYTGYFPLKTNIYDKSLKAMWEKVANHTTQPRSAPLIITHQGLLMFYPTI